MIREVPADDGADPLALHGHGKVPSLPQFFADIDAAVLDGTTLDLGMLTGTRSALMNVFGNIAAQVDSGIEGWYQVNEFGDGTLSVATH